VTRGIKKNALGPKAKHAVNGDEAAPKQVQLPSEGFVRQPVVLAVFATSKTTLWRWVSSGQFPRPYKLSPGTVAWDVQELRDHMKKIRAGNGA